MDSAALGKQTTQRAKVTVNPLFSVGDRFVTSRSDSCITLLQSVSKIPSPHLISLPAISISFCMNKRKVTVGPTEMESMIKECCGCCGCVLATADAPSVAVSPNGNYEEKTKEMEMKEAESGDEVRLREIVMRINERATKLRIIKSIAEKSPPPPVASGCKLAFMSLLNKQS